MSVVEEEFSVKGLEPMMNMMAYIPSLFAIIVLSQVDAQSAGDVNHGLAGILLLLYGFGSGPVLMATDTDYLKALLAVRLAMAGCAAIAGIIVGASGSMG